MLKTPTLERLRTLGLEAMAQGLMRQRETPDIDELSFEDRLGLLLDLEATARDQRLMDRRLREAHLRMQACLEDVRIRPARGLDRGTILAFADDAWIRHHEVVVITGATGTGKTYLACALAQAACRSGHSARYYRLSRLLEDLALSRVQGRWDRVLTRLGRCAVLVLDDFGLCPLTAEQARDLLEVIDDRTDQRSTILVSQLPQEKWHAMIPDPTVADALLDRLVHQAQRIALKGESMRKLLPKRETQAERAEGERVGRPLAQSAADEP